MTKKDYIVSNTINVNPYVSGIVRHDIFRTNGKYCFVYPSVSAVSIMIQTAIVGEAIAYAEQEKSQTLNTLISCTEEFGCAEEFSCE